jgi:hypothetical protein
MESQIANQEAQIVPEAAKALTAEQLAERWQVDRNTIYVKIREGSLPTLALFGKPRIPLQAIEEIEYCGTDKNETYKERRLRMTITQKEQEISELKAVIRKMLKAGMEVSL